MGGNDFHIFLFSVILTIVLIIAIPVTPDKGDHTTKFEISATLKFRAHWWHGTD